MAAYQILRKTGRCASGAEADGGVRYHAVPPGGPWAKAICGTVPGDAGNGWGSYPGDKVNCPACLRKLAKLNQASA